MPISRRSFLKEAGAAAAAGLVVPQAAHALPAVSHPGSRPIAVSSLNGLRGVAKAYELMTSGVDPLDAAIQGVMIQELDPNDQSVGLGGLPNEDGVVQLDASVMHPPTQHAGPAGGIVII